MSTYPPPPPLSQPAAPQGPAGGVTGPPPPRQAGQQAPAASSTSAAPTGPNLRPPTPVGGARWKAAEQQGLLHLFVTSGGVQQVDTMHGVSDVVHCDHIIAFTPEGAVRWERQAVFGAVLTQQLALGGQIVGTVGQGVAQQGRSAPWMVLDPTPEQTAWVEAQWAHLFDPSGRPLPPVAEEGKVYSPEEPF